MLSHYMICILVCVGEDIWAHTAGMAKVSERVHIEYQLRANHLRYSTSPPFLLQDKFVSGVICGYIFFNLQQKPK